MIMVQIYLISIKKIALPQIVISNMFTVIVSYLYLFYHKDVTLSFRHHAMRKIDRVVDLQDQHSLE